MYDIEILGLLQLDRRLDSLSPVLQTRLRAYFGVFLLRLKGQVKNNIAILFNRGLRDEGGRFKFRGAMYNAVKAEQTLDGSENVGIVTVDTPYASIQEFGGQTPPHVIIPRTASVLAFEGPAGLVFAKSVNHPGSRIPERSYARLALARMRGEFQDGIREIVADVASPDWELR